MANSNLSESDLRDIDWSADVSFQSKKNNISTHKEVNPIVKDFVEAEFYEDKLDEYLDNKEAVFSDKDVKVHEKLLIDAEKYMDNTSEKLKKVIIGASVSNKKAVADNALSFHLKITNFIGKMHKDINIKDMRQLSIDYKSTLGLYKLLTKKEKKLFYDDLMTAYNLINDYKKNKKVI